MHGDAVGVGVGVFGDTTNGFGVIARASGSGTALDVRGKARFSRSGRITTAAGQAQWQVILAGATQTAWC